MINEDHLWTKTEPWSMPAFLEAYTLHDSGLWEVRTDSSLGMLVLIDWDLHWNSTIPAGFGLLAIRFLSPYYSTWVQGAWHQSTLGGATSRLVSEEEREAMLNDSKISLSAFQSGSHAHLFAIQPYMFDQTLTRTFFQFINWGYLEILHGHEVGFACFDDQGNPGTIPKPHPSI